MVLNFYYLLSRPLGGLFGFVSKNYRCYLWGIRYIPQKALAYLGYLNAISAYYHAKKSVPAYQDFLKNYPGKDIPETDKDVYIKLYPLQDRCVKGCFLKPLVMIDESSGSTGTPFNWIRCEKERLETHRFVHYYCRYNFGDGPLVTLNAFSQGAWATGWNMGLALHHNGVIKNTGPDVQKILQTMTYLGPTYSYLILGYPPFLKHLLDEAEAHEFPLKQYRLFAIVGGEGMSEGLRDYLSKVSKKVYSGFGATDLEMGIGGESDLSIALRRLSQSDRRVKEALFGTESRSPMVFQYNPFLYYIEVNDQAELVYTITRKSLLSPRIRYNVHDKGGIATFDSVEKRLNLLGYSLYSFCASKKLLKLPFLWVFGRSDYTVSVMGANLYPEDIEQCVYHLPKLAKNTMSYCLSSSEEKNGLVRPAILLEVHDIPNQETQSEIRAEIVAFLTQLNTDFDAAYKEYPEILTPKVDYYLAGTGPFKTHQGHIKQRRVIHTSSNALNQ